MEDGIFGKFTPNRLPLTKLSPESHPAPKAPNMVFQPYLVLFFDPFVNLQADR
jgi:hypothetical protein